MRLLPSVFPGWRRLRSGRGFTGAKQDILHRAAAGFDSTAALMPGELDWPLDKAFRHVAADGQLTNGKVLCRRVAVCDSKGAALREVPIGQTLHVSVEWEVVADIAFPVFLLRLGDGNEQVLLRSVAFSDADEVASAGIPGGHFVRVRHVLHADIPPGIWFLQVECISPVQTLTVRCHRELLEDDDFLTACDNHCFARLTTPVVTVQSRDTDNVSRRTAVHIVRGGRKTSVPSPDRDDPFPALLHVTHWKAGSQWIYAILRALFPERIVPPQIGSEQIRRWPIQAGRVYPTVYLTRGELERHRLPPAARTLVVLRDLRDTLISWYFSFKVSHRVMTTRMAKYRELLNRLSVEEGLLTLLDYQAPHVADIQRSWMDGPEPIVRYEELLNDDVGTLKRVLLDQFALPVSQMTLSRAVESCRFEKLSGGRHAGELDVNSHYRNGTAGDWRRHFTPRVTAAVKAKFGELLIATGYERGLDW